MTRSILLRAAAVAALTISTLAAPVATVHACSCMAFSVADAVQAASLALIGTVADSAPGGQDPVMGVPLVRYAFEVERASAATGPIVEVVSHDDPGGASCGFAFGAGERWFVAASTDGGLLRTTLCSGNRLIDDLGADEMRELVELLPIEPVPADVPEGGDLSIPPPILVALIGAGILIGSAVWAFRRDRPS